MTHLGEPGSGSWVVLSLCSSMESCPPRRLLPARFDDSLHADSLGYVWQPATLSTLDMSFAALLQCSSDVCVCVRERPAPQQQA